MGVYDMKNREPRRKRLSRLGWALGTWKRQIKVYRKLFDEFMLDEPYDKIGVDPGHPEGNRSVTLEISPKYVMDVVEGEDE